MIGDYDRILSDNKSDNSDAAPFIAKLTQHFFGEQRGPRPAMNRSDRKLSTHGRCAGLLSNSVSKNGVPTHTQHILPTYTPNRGNTIKSATWHVTQPAG